jgi:nucleoside 2-deoxyribosyltransferase
MRKLPRLYLAAPLFSQAEKAFNHDLKKELSAHFEVFLPQEDGGLLLDWAHDYQGKSL